MVRKKGVRVKDEFDMLFEEEKISNVQELGKYEVLHTPHSLQALRMFILAGVKWMDARTAYVFQRGFSLFMFRQYLAKKICTEGSPAERADCVTDYVQKSLGLSPSEQYLLMLKFIYIANAVYTMSPNSTEIMRLGLKWLITKGEQEIKYMYHGFLPSKQFHLPKIWEGEEE